MIVHVYAIPYNDDKIFFYPIVHKPVNRRIENFKRRMQSHPKIYSKYQKVIDNESPATKFLKRMPKETDKVF